MCVQTSLSRPNQDPKTTIQNGLRTLIPNMRKEDVVSIRKKFVHYLVYDGQIQQKARKKYLHFMSEQRFAQQIYTIE